MRPSGVPSSEGQDSSAGMAPEVSQRPGGDGV